MSEAVALAIVALMSAIVALMGKVLMDRRQVKKINGTSGFIMTRTGVERIAREVMGNPGWQDDIDKAIEGLRRELSPKFDELAVLWSKYDGLDKRCRTCQTDFTRLKTIVEMRDGGKNNP